MARAQPDKGQQSIQAVRQNNWQSAGAALRKQFSSPAAYRAPATAWGDLRGGTDSNEQ